MLLFFLACTGLSSEPPIPGVPDAVDTATPDTASEEPEEPEQIGPVTPPWLPPLLLNEVQTSNHATVMSQPGVFPDWLELFNASTEAIDLRRVELRKEGEDGVRLEGELAPGVHLLLWEEDLGTSLSKEGERLELVLDGVVVDRIATGQLTTDTAWARFPDGGTWQVTARPTPGWTNGSRPSDTIDPSELLFDDETIHEIQLTMSASALQDLADDRYTEVPAAITVRGAWFPQVGVRLKGQWGSQRELSQKCSWKVDLNEYAGHSLYGQEVLTLNNMVQDPTYVHEHLAYEVYRAAGLPAPRTSWAWVAMNTTEYGLYAVIETIDEHFLARWYTDPTGRMWEGKYGQDFDGSGIDELDFDQGPDDDRSSLYAVAAILDGAATDAAILQLEELVDLDQWLATVAVETLILHWDGYTTSNNYRLYEDPVSGRLSILPWGTDQTFITNYYGPHGGQGELIKFCMANAACRSRYDQWLLDVADIMDSLDLAAHLDRHLEQLEELIAADPRAETDAAGHAAYVEATRNTIATWPDQVRAQAAP